MWRTSSATPSDPRDRSLEDTNARRAYSPVDSIDVTYLAPEGLHALHAERNDEDARLGSRHTSRRSNAKANACDARSRRRSADERTRRVNKTARRTHHLLRHDCVSVSVE